MLHAVYVDHGREQVIGLAPKEAFFAPILAMRERDDVVIVATEVAFDWGWWRRGRVELPVQKSP